MPVKPTSLERILGRLDNLDTTNLTILVQRLARERSLLETVINTVREGILLIDRRGLIDFANAAALKLIGLRESDIGTAILWKLVPELARELSVSSSGEYAGLTTVTREFELAYPEARAVRIYIVPVEELDKSVHVRFAVILSDITQDRLHTLEQLESERVNSIFQLAAGVAHELGNPLNSLTIHLQLLKRQAAKMEDEAGREKLAAALDVCTREVERLDGIITHFLEAVRPKAPDLRDLDLITPLEEALEFIGPELADSGISVDIDVGTRPPIVSADPELIKQVYFNVLKNAREAMEGGGNIHVRASSDDDFVTIAIGDTGGGMGAENLSKVFQPYFTTKKSGHGLGMMIVQRIMNAHGGRIGMESKDGVGTLVTLQFPHKHRRMRMLEQAQDDEGQTA